MKKILIVTADYYKDIADGLISSALKIIPKKNIIKIIKVPGAFEIYIFFWIIGVDAKVSDVLIIESVTAIIRSAAFFIPSAIGVQELAFVIVGELVGYSSIVSFSVAIGRRLRDIMVGIPAIITWIFIFRKQSNHFN